MTKSKKKYSFEITLEKINIFKNETNIFSADGSENGSADPDVRTGSGRPAPAPNWIRTSGSGSVDPTNKKY